MMAVRRSTLDIFEAVFTEFSYYEDNSKYTLTYYGGQPRFPREDEPDGNRQYREPGIIMRSRSP